MVSIEVDQLYTWLNAFLWPFVRLLAFLSTAPLLGESSIPTRAKVGLAAFLSIIIAPTLPTPPAISPASYEGLFITLQQFLIGTILGLVMRIVFAAVQTAGEFIGLQMGLSFASFFDPQTGANTAVLARLMNMIAMLLFLAVNGHLLMLAGLIRSFDLLPISSTPIQSTGLGVLFDWSAQVMISGMLLALPLIIVLLSISLALGILNRTAQQLSVFAVGFPISLLVGLILLWVVLPQIAPFVQQLFDSGYDAMGRVINAL
ncbi:MULTISPECIES: flagellar biosynthetic protein FliR [unclassified Pusillimonas]|uniref:flagellar biosynthetic protein FliR n=1 Tax=unclassified Pusillimonas TaxID=2640016 RepID=UPI000B9CD9CB|nr:MULTISPECIES: flagellar biosynthetic protein FliR [unclassified Pusillimonas]OXR49692.1 flagellar biosynthetic protein FliR [Pusillimonas sp. T2]ROT45094.1 flagellar biosynthetic protein FliR [Pusillimonas sp. NJUB218]